MDASHDQGISKTATALRATSDNLLATLDALAALEQEKRMLEPGDATTVELSAQIAVLAERVLSASVAQQKLTERALEEEQAGGPDAPGISIEETPRPLSAILEEWRHAERRAAEARARGVDVF